MGDREYVDHEDCDRRRIRDRLDEMGLKDVTPFWAVQEDNLADVTKSCFKSYYSVNSASTCSTCILNNLQVAGGSRRPSCTCVEYNF